MNEQIHIIPIYPSVKHVFNMISVLQMYKSMNKKLCIIYIIKLLNVKFVMEPIILYINSVSLSVSQFVEVLKPRSLLIKLSPLTQGPKNYSRPRVLTSYFYVHFHKATAVVNGGGIFGIWRVGEEIWVCFFWAKGLWGSWFLFFSWRGGGGGVLGVLIGGNELEWEMRKTGWGGSTGCIMHRVHTSNHYRTTYLQYSNIIKKKNTNRTWRYL
jgi:hypothetical protein